MESLTSNKKSNVALLLCLFLALAPSIAFSRSIDLVDMQLKQLNKLPLKSIMSPDGDIIDCVHISQQPAFDHPLLKTHTIQMMPSSTPEGLTKDKQNSTKQIWHLKGMCPEDTIPIRRTKREEILRASAIENFGKKTQEYHPASNPGNGHEHAVAYVQGGKYYGSKATIELWNPFVEQENEFSLAQTWVKTQDNTIEAGWTVFPGLYSDHSTRLFIYWTNDNYGSTGCYNLLCPGFVQTSNKIAIGGALSPVSTYIFNQRTVTVYAWKDPKQGNWWLQLGDELVGYWPAELFSHLNDGATMIEWGGEVINQAANGSHTSTQMGSGDFAEVGTGFASFFKNIQVVDESHNLQNANNLQTLTDTLKTCYDIKLGDVPVAGWDSYFYYGGPGLNPNCP